MKVLVAGASGFVGSWVSRDLLRAGHEVVGLRRRRIPQSSQSAVSWVQADLGDGELSWAARVGSVDAVVNAVGLLTQSGRQTFERVVVGGTRRLLRAARNLNAQTFVQVSANGVQAARVAYQVAKLDAESAVRESGLSWTILRPSIVYGPGDDVTTRFGKLANRGLVPVVGDGRYRWMPLAVWDLAQAVRGCMESDRFAGEIIHLCGPDDVSFGEWVDLVRSQARRRGVRVRIPEWAARLGAAVAGHLPRARIDADALEMLLEGNSCSQGDAGLRRLGVTPTRLQEGISLTLGSTNL